MLSSQLPGGHLHHRRADGGSGVVPQAPALRQGLPGRTRTRSRDEVDLGRSGGGYVLVQRRPVALEHVRRHAHVLARLGLRTERGSGEEQSAERRVYGLVRGGLPVVHGAPPVRGGAPDQCADAGLCQERAHLESVHGKTPSVRPSLFPNPLPSVRHRAHTRTCCCTAPTSCT